MAPSISRFTTLISLIVVILVSLNSPGQGQTCYEYERDFRIVGTLVTPESSWDVAITGSIAFVQEGGKIQVVDVSDPEHPLIRSTFSLPDDAEPGAITIEGNYAYLGGSDGKFYVLDISSPLTPFVAGSVTVPDHVPDVAISGSYAYLACYQSGVQIVDISNPAVPVVVGSVPLDGYYTYVTEVVGNHLYVGGGGGGLGGLMMYDITTPDTPSFVHSPEDLPYVFGMAVHGDAAYLGCYKSGLRVLDITTPEAPILYPGSGSSGDARDVVVSYPYAFVQGQFCCVEVVDVSIPSQPTVVDRFFSDTHDANGLALSGSHLYAAMDGVMQIIDFSVPNTDALVGSRDTDGQADGLAVSGDYAYLADGTAGFKVFDITNRRNPSLIGTESYPYGAENLEIVGIYAYVAGSVTGLSIIDISNPGSPSQVGAAATEGASFDVAVYGNVALLADWDSGLAVVDISDPGSPELLGSVATPGPANEVSVAGDYAVVACQESGIAVFDLSDPILPALVASRGTPGTVSALCVAGDYAYVAVKESGLCVFDISNPTSPNLQGFVDLPGNADAVSVVDGFAYVGCGDAGLAVVDVSDPWGLVLRGVIDTPHLADVVDFAPPYVYIADGNSGIQVARMQCESYTDPPVNVTVAYSSSGNQISWSAGNKAAISHFNIYRADFPGFTPGEAYLLYEKMAYSLFDRYGTFEDHYKITAVDINGTESAPAVPMEISGVPVRGGRMLGLHQNSPNPFNPQTTIAFDLPKQTAVSLTVFDLSGRLVRVLVDGEIIAEGRNEASWNGRDDTGKRVASGTYFYRLEAGEYSETKRMALIK